MLFACQFIYVDLTQITQIVDRVIGNHFFFTEYVGFYGIIQFLGAQNGQNLEASLI